MEMERERVKLRKERETRSIMVGFCIDIDRTAALIPSSLPTLLIVVGMNDFGPMRVRNAQRMHAYSLLRGCAPCCSFRHRSLGVLRWWFASTGSLGSDAASRPLLILLSRRIRCALPARHR